jgi:CTP synthase
VDEQKTKPTQQSVNLLQSRGLFPDIVIARGKQQLTQESLYKIALFSNLRDERVFSIPDVDCIYKIPEILARQNFDRLIHGKLSINYEKSKKLEQWNLLYNNKKTQKKTVAIIGKYTALEDSYSSVVAALEHVGFHLGLDIEVQFLDTRKEDVISKLDTVDACIVP